MQGFIMKIYYKRNMENLDERNEALKLTMPIIARGFPIKEPEILTKYVN
jgi:hypothetical protein